MNLSLIDQFFDIVCDINAQFLVLKVTKSNKIDYRFDLNYAVKLKLAV